MVHITGLLKLAFCCDKTKINLDGLSMYGLNYQEANFFSSIRCFVIEGKM